MPADEFVSFPLCVRCAYTRGGGTLRLSGLIRLNLAFKRNRKAFFNDAGCVTPSDWQNQCLNNNILSDS